MDDRTKETASRLWKQFCTYIVLKGVTSSERGTSLTGSANGAESPTLNLMSGGGICVCFFVEILRTSQPKISRHLAYLRREGLVAARREGKLMHYRLIEPADPNVAAILRETLEHLTERRDMQRDSARLRSACCPPGKLVALQSTPLPAAPRRR